MRYRLDDRERSELVALLTKLVATPSANPSMDGSIPELAMADAVSSELARAGVAVERYVMADGRPNVRGYWGDVNRSSKLVLEAHADTVGVEGMSEPFNPTIRDGKMFGRGTCDTKGALAAYLWVMKRLTPDRMRLPWSVEFWSVADEERGCLGSLWLAERNIVGDMMIIGEPTGCRVACYHKGRMTITLVVHGQAAHASVPETGINAIDGMAILLAAIRERWQVEIAATHHPVLGNGTSSVTQIVGGVRDNIIPDRCEVTFDVRTVPPTDERALIESLKRVLSDASQGKIAFEVKSCEVRAALATEPTCEVAQRMLDAAGTCGESNEAAKLPFLTDASSFTPKGSKCIVFGPGYIEQAHRLDEYLELSQLVLSAEILMTMMQQAMK